MLTKIVDEIIHDLSVLEFTNPLQFEELCSSIESIEAFIVERCPYSIECIRDRIKGIVSMFQDDDDEI